LASNVNKEPTIVVKVYVTFVMSVRFIKVVLVDSGGGANLETLDEND
jgi:hypothetical protein